MSEPKSPVIKDNGTIIDEHGELWLQETANAWRRESDKFYWNGDPTELNSQNQKAPTVEHSFHVKSKYTKLN